MQTTHSNDAFLNPTDKVVISYLIIIAGLAVISMERTRYWWAVLVGHAAVISLIVSMASLQRRASWRYLLTFARAWYPLILIPGTYKELTYLIPKIHPRDFDWELATIDHRLLGVHPTIWLERITLPALTELFQLSYITYYFLPIVLGVALWRKGWTDKFQFLLFVVVLGFYLSYLGYIAVPATGPRFILADQQSFPLSGVWLFDSIRSTLDHVEGVTRDCFPSGHVELTLLVLYYAHRFHRRVFRWILPAGSALIISTVYLRYHYVIDVIGGAVLALGIVLTARPLYRLLGGAPLAN